MEFKLTVGFDKEALTVLNKLASALTGQFEAAPANEGVQEEKPKTTKTKAKAKEVKKTDKQQGPIYWYNSTDKTRGVVDTIEEFEALKATDENYVQHVESMYEEGLAADKKQAEQEQAAAVKAKADAEIAKLAAETAKRAKDKKAAEKTKSVEEVAEKVPTEEDVIASFSAYLTPGLSDEEKEIRRPIVKAILTRFGAKRATMLAEEDRALAINLVDRAAAGEEIDPENDEYQEVGEDLV